MLRLITVLFLLVSVSFANFNIMSWNTKRLSSKTIKFKDQKILKSIINNEKHDIVVLQELMDKSVVEKLTNKRHYISEKLGRKSYKEYTSFILSDKFKFSSAKLYTYYDTHNSFERNPVMLLIDSEIAIVSVHLLYSRVSSKKHTGNKYEFTKREIKALKNMSRYFANKADIDEDKIIIVGDFNLSKRKIKNILKDKKVYIGIPTTLTSKEGKLGLNSYDHFVVSRNTYLRDTKVDYSVLDRYLGNNGSEARKYFKNRVSDHYPISATVEYRSDF